MENIYNAIQNVYNMDKTSWQEVLAELYNLVSKVENKFDLFENKFGQLLGEEVTIQLKKMYDDGSLASLVLAFKTEVNEQLETKANKDDVAKISTGTPLFAQSTIEMIDTTRNYVNTTDGYLYIYSGGKWTKTSVLYQSTGLSDYSVDRLQATDEVLSMYPFQPRATLKHDKINLESISILRNSIKRIELYNADEKRKYFLNYISRSNDGNNVLTINIKNDLGVIVANIDKWYFGFNNDIQKVKLTEQNNSGVSGYIYIDFSIFTPGNGYYNMEYDETGIAQECLYSFKEPIEKTEWLRLSLPSKIYGVVGQELNIYFDNIILCNNINNYQIDVECEKGIQQVERWTYTPTSLGSFNITIKVYKDGKSLVASKSTTIDVKSNTGTGTKKALFIGDSLTDYNQYIQEIVNLFNEDTCDIKLLGTKGWNEQARHEGRSGWSTVSYAQRASVSDVVNPFWNTSTSKFDFSYYLTNNSIETPDIVVIMLGTNDVGGNSANATTIANIKTMITSIKASNSNIKIGVALTPPPASTQDGFGKMNQCWSTRFQAKQGNFDLVEDFITEFDNNKIENVSVIPTNVNLDTVNNFPYEEVKPNSRATATIKRISDNVHPTESGMYQFADTYYGWLKSFY